MTGQRAQLIKERLVKRFSPMQIQVDDQSHLHAGHAGAREGKGHFSVTIVADAFEGHNRIARHRMVFEALDDLMQTDIHALSICAYAPMEQN